MNVPPALRSPGKPSRAKHNSNHRRQRRKLSKIPNISSDNALSTDCRYATSNVASNSDRPKRLPERIVPPVVSSGGVEEGVAKKKTARGRPNRPWKPWAKLSLTEIEHIAERRGNGGRGFEQ
jgi:hypothetical protein